MRWRRSNPHDLELYDYDADPHETINHAADSAYQAKVEGLRAVLRSHFGPRQSAKGGATALLPRWTGTYVMNQSTMIQVSRRPSALATGGSHWGHHPPSRAPTPPSGVQ